MTGCDDTACCGPIHDEDAAEVIEEWCSPSEPYTTIPVGERSDQYEVYEGEVRYHRFYIPEDHYCQEIQVNVRSEYGTANLYLSNLYALPDGDTASWFRDTSEFAWAQTSITLCPTMHSDYSIGTFALAVEGNTDTSYYVEVVASNQPYPLEDPQVGSGNYNRDRNCEFEIFVKFLPLFFLKRYSNF